LTDARKQLLVQAYAAVAMNEAKIVNNLAEKVVANPNELSGARPANVVVPNANANSNANTTPTTTPANTNTNATNAKPVNTTANKPAANTAKANANR
jgi:hypothetical protein